MKHCLVSGAGGFIGGYLVEESLKKGYHTFAGIRQSTSRRYLTDSRINFVILNLDNVTRIKEQLNYLKKQGIKLDLIVHNLGITKCNDPKDFHKINVTYLQNFVMSLIETDMIPKRFILMSSLGVKLTETAYGKSKIEAENFLKSIPNFPWNIIRPTGVYGPRETDYLLLIKSIKNHLYLKIGQEEQFLTFIFVEDLVKAIFQLADTDHLHQIYELSENRSYSAHEVCDIIQKQLGIKLVFPITVPLFILRLFCATSQKFGQIFDRPSTLNSDKYKILKYRDWRCDIKHAQKDFNFNPETDLETGIIKTITWYKAHKWI